MKIMRSTWACKDCGEVFAFRVPLGFLSEKAKFEYAVWRWEVEIHKTDCVNGRVEAFLKKGVIK